MGNDLIWWTIIESNIVLTEVHNIFYLEWLDYLGFDGLDKSGVIFEDLGVFVKVPGWLIVFAVEHGGHV